MKILSYIVTAIILFTATAFSVQAVPFQGNTESYTSEKIAGWLPTKNDTLKMMEPIVCRRDETMKQIFQKNDYSLGKTFVAHATTFTIYSDDANNMVYVMPDRDIATGISRTCAVMKGNGDKFLRIHSVKPRVWNVGDKPIKIYREKHYGIIKPPEPESPDYPSR